MDQLTPAQQAIISDLVGAVRGLPGLASFVLGGSHARGRARPDSDIDLGLLYRDTDPFAIDRIRTIAERFSDSPGPVVTDFGAWGPWVDGGAWMTIRGQRVDFLYRSIDRIERTLREAEAGRFEIHFDQQPPFGFFGPTLLGEVAIAHPLLDDDGLLSRLKAHVSSMPEALVRAVVQSRLWSIEFGLSAFAPKFAAAGNTYAVAGCLARFAHALVLTLFALNRTYFLSEKTALAEIEAFRSAPRDFPRRVSDILACPGRTPPELSAACSRMRALFDEVAALSAGLYTPSFKL